jgi:16S rRNA processing protein RimM
LSADSDPLVRLGDICGVHGVKGWVKVHSYTEPRSNLADYSNWLLSASGRQRLVHVEAATMSGKNLIAKLPGVDDRDAAQALIGTEIFVRKSELPACAPGEYYWADLQGLEVRSLSGAVLGIVTGLIATGANDVLVVSGPRAGLIPYIAGSIVHRVDLEAGLMVVDWDASFWE